MDQEKLSRASALEAEAARLRKEAFEQRPLPDQWRVGQKVRYLKNQDRERRAGSVATIVAIHGNDVGKPATEYSVFWTSLDNGKTHQYWTASSDVELVEDV